MMINYCQKSTFKIELSVPIHTGFDKFLFSLKIIRIRDMNRRKKKERNDYKKLQTKTNK